MYTKEEYLSVSHLALERLERSRSSLDQTLYQSIQTVVDGMEGGVAHLTPPPDPVVVLDSVVQDLQKSADERSGVLHKSSRGLTSFLLSILRELREIICGKGKKPKPLGKEAHAAVSALAALLTARLGIFVVLAVHMTLLLSR